MALFGDTPLIRLPSAETVAAAPSDKNHANDHADTGHNIQ
jgi:hypothetical protein